MNIGPYEILGEIGRGGMGVVHRARSPEGHEVALKVLQQIDAASLARFEREQRILTGLGEEAGFVPLIDRGVSAGRPYVVMPFLTGGTLRERLRRGPLPVAEARELGLALARALGAAHARGIVHRDLKPANILFTAKARPLVADLGLAKELGGGDSHLAGSLSSQGLGTLGYMPPEQIDDARSVGPTADVFALGAVLYECLAGRKAFEGGVLSFAKRVAEGPERLAVVRPDAPLALAGAIERALAARPAERHPDGSAFARALESAGKRRVVRRFVLLLLGVAVVLAAGGLSAWSWRSKRLAAARTALEEGRVLEHRDDHRGAIAALDRAIALDPELAAAWAVRGQARAELSDLDGGLADAARALELDPRCADAYEGRAEVRLARREFDAAIADFTRAIELDPRMADAWNNRAVARISKKDAVGAVADATRSIELDPSGATRWLNRANMEEATDPERAISDATHALTLAPGLDVGWNVRARLRQAKGDHEGAADDWTHAIERAPRVIDYWGSRALERFRLGDMEGAIGDLTKVLELDPGHTKALGYRAAAHQMRGDTQEAIADYERFLSLAPDDEAAPEMRAALEKLRAR